MTEYSTAKIGVRESQVISAVKNLSSFLPSPLVLVAFMLSFLAIYAVKIPLLQDADIGWHIAAGDFIRTHEIIIPTHDPWSFSGEVSGSQQIWYNISWLWDVLLSVIHQSLGLEGIFVFAKICTALVMAMQVYFLQKRGSIDTGAIIFTALITSFCMMEFAYGRPQIIGFLLLLIFNHILHRTRELYSSTAQNNMRSYSAQAAPLNGASRRYAPQILLQMAKHRACSHLFTLPLLMVLWANVHGSFFTAAAVLGAFGIESISQKNWRWLRHLLLVGTLCSLATLINPYGIYIFVGIVRTLHSEITKYIIEWRPFIFGDAMGASMWLLVFIYASNLRYSTVPLADKLLALAGLFAMLLSIRNVGTLAVLGAPYLAANMPHDDKTIDRIRRMDIFANNRNISPALAVMAVVVVVAAQILLPIIGKPHYLEEPDKSPLPAINYVKEHYATKRILNDYNLGGRMIYETNGQVNIFIDGRAGTAYTEKVISDYLSFFNMDKDWQQRLEPYKIEVIIVFNKSAFVKSFADGAYNQEWKKVFGDEVASVYERRKQDDRKQDDSGK